MVLSSSFAALIVVVVVYLVVALVLRLLAAMQTPTATVAGTLSHGDNRIWFTAAGIVGVFIVLVIIALGAVYILRG